MVKSKRKVKSTIIVPEKMEGIEVNNSDNSDDLVNRVTETVRKAIGKKRSRSLGDETDIRDSKLTKTKKDSSPKKGDEQNNEDLREKINQIRQERKSRSRSKGNAKDDDSSNSS